MGFLVEKIGKWEWNNSWVGIAGDVAEWSNGICWRYGKRVDILCLQKQLFIISNVVKGYGYERQSTQYQRHSTRQSRRNGYDAAIGKRDHSTLSPFLQRHFIIYYAKCFGKITCRCIVSEEYTLSDGSINSWVAKGSIGTCRVLVTVIWCGTMNGSDKIEEQCVFDSRKQCV